MLCVAADSSDVSEQTRDSHKPRPHVCTVREKSFIEKRDLKDHLRLHSVGDLLTCSQCGKCFTSRSLLRRHSNVHSGKYKCVECGRKCDSNSFRKQTV